MVPEGEGNRCNEEVVKMFTYELPYSEKDDQDKAYTNGYVSIWCNHCFLFYCFIDPINERCLPAVFTKNCILCAKLVILCTSPFGPNCEV